MSASGEETTDFRLRQHDVLVVNDMVGDRPDGFAFVVRDATADQLALATIALRDLGMPAAIFARRQEAVGLLPASGGFTWKLEQRIRQRG